MGTVTFRPDPETERALTQLTEDGQSTSAAIRQAILDAARMRQRERVREQSLRLAADPDDLAEIRRIHEDAEDLRAW